MNTSWTWAGSSETRSKAPAVHTPLGKIYRDHTQAHQAKKNCGKSLDDILDNCAPLMAKDPSCVAEKEESEPCKLPNGVRTALTITGVR